jgi:hypothetical protein
MAVSRTSKPSTLKLILVPSLVSLGVTLLRLTGELNQWSPRWFSTHTGGITPSGVSWVIGITWLAVPFGAYFGWRLAAAGDGPIVSVRKALLIVLLSLAVYRVGMSLIPAVGFPRVLVFVWLVMAVAAAIQHFVWPSLYKTLLYYGLASRIPVVVVMFLAMLYDWGTHYDYVGMPPQFSMDLLPRFLWLAFFPQLVFWVGFTILIGSVAGLAAGFLSMKRTAGAGREPKVAGRLD